jgi:hypothetical protein
LSQAAALAGNPRALSVFDSAVSDVCRIEYERREAFVPVPGWVIPGSGYEQSFASLKFGKSYDRPVSEMSKFRLVIIDGSHIEEVDIFDSHGDSSSPHGIGNDWRHSFVPMANGCTSAIAAASCALNAWRDIKRSHNAIGRLYPV